MLTNKIISELDFENLQNLMSGKKSFDAFRDKYSEKVDVKYVLDALSLAKALSDLNLYRNILFGFGYLLSKADKLSLYRMAILEGFHREHEEIITTLQVSYKNEVDNILFIQKIVNNIPSYLSCDNDLKESFLKKCMFALSFHPKPNSVKALGELAKSNDEMISRLATHHL